MKQPVIAQIGSGSGIIRTVRLRAPHRPRRAHRIIDRGVIQRVGLHCRAGVSGPSRWSPPSLPKHRLHGPRRRSCPRQQHPAKFRSAWCPVDLRKHSQQDRSANHRWPMCNIPEPALGWRACCDRGHRANNSKLHPFTSPSLDCIGVPASVSDRSTHRAVPRLHGASSAPEFTPTMSCKWNSVWHRSIPSTATPTALSLSIPQISCCPRRHLSPQKEVRMRQWIYTAATTLSLSPCLVR